MLRNQYMIAQSTRLIAAYNEEESNSGTAQTMRMAEKAGLEIVRIFWDKAAEGE